MGRSRGVYSTVRIPIEMENMATHEIRRLRQIINRDTRMIRRYLNLIHKYRKILLVKTRYGWSIDQLKLNELTLTTEIKMPSNNYKLRKKVPHDIKKQFPRATQTEIIECQQTAIGIYNAFVEIEYQKPNGKRFSKGPKLRKTNPRGVGGRSFSINLEDKSLKLLDSMDTSLLKIKLGKSKMNANKLLIPLKLGNYHINKLSMGESKSLRLVKKNSKLIWIHVNVKVDKKQEDRYAKTSNKPIAVLGIDLGIKIAAACVVITKKGILHNKTFRLNSELLKKVNRLNDRITDIQREIWIRNLKNFKSDFNSKVSKFAALFPNQNSSELHLMRKIQGDLNQVKFNFSKVGARLKKSTKKLTLELESKTTSLRTIHKSNDLRIKSKQNCVNSLLTSLQGLIIICNKKNLAWIDKTDGLFKLLRKYSSKRHTLMLEADRKLVSEIMAFIHQLNSSHDIYIGIGKLSGIKKRMKRGNGKPVLRKIIHSWTYFRITELLSHKISTSGLHKRILEINEAYTSILCWRCSERGNRRFQRYFKCKNPNCKWQGNADINGATNIAKRAIRYFKLTSNNKNVGVRGLDVYASKSIFVGNRRSIHKGNAGNTNPPVVNVTVNQSPGIQELTEVSSGVN